MLVQPILISYHTCRWIRVAVRSYLQHCPERVILVIDNNPDEHEVGWSPLVEEERRWLATQQAAIVLKNTGTHKHGSGIDLAMRWCRAEGVQFMLHFEPDCVISGPGWREALVSALESGADMAGTRRRQHGPIHVTPTLWRVQVDWPSFGVHPRQEDERHPRFAELFDLANLRRRTDDRRWSGFWCKYWDTAEKAWFSAAVRDKAFLVRGKNASGIKHYFRGSRERRDHPDLDGPLASLVAY